MLDKFGKDNLPFSPGHEGKLGGRSSPSTYNAAIHIAQFWDGRAADASRRRPKAPCSTRSKWACSSEEFVVKVLKSMPGYVEGLQGRLPRRGRSHHL
jgi:cytochrome c peroxidase